MKSFVLSVLLIGVLLISHSFAGDEIYTIEINQASVRMPHLMAYLYVLKSDGSMASFKGNERFTALLGDKPVQITEILPPDKITEGIAYIFLIDISKSLKASQFKDLQENVIKWIGRLKDNDIAALMTFGSEVKTIKIFNSNKDELKKAVSNIQQSDYQTRLYGALKHAIQWSQSHLDTTLPARRAIVILSDGINDFEGGETKDDVIRALSVNPVPIYALGYSKPPMNSKKEEGLKTLGEFAHKSGGRYVRVRNDNFQNFFSEIQKRIYDVYELKIDCSRCPADGRIYRLRIDLNTGQKVISDGIDVRIVASHLPAPQSEDKPLQWWEKIPLWGYIAGGALLVIIIAVVIVIVHNKNKKAEEMRRSLESARQAELEQKKMALEEPHPQYPLTVMDVTGGQRGIKIRLDKIGIFDRDIKFKTNIVNNLTIGRGDCDVVISGDDQISKKHCQIVNENGILLIVDLNSTNGTFLNGVPIKNAIRLNSGDIITLGRTEMRITFANE